MLYVCCCKSNKEEKQIPLARQVVNENDPRIKTIHEYVKTYNKHNVEEMTSFTQSNCTVNCIIGTPANGKSWGLQESINIYIAAIKEKKTLSGLTILCANSVGVEYTYKVTVVTGSYYIRTLIQFDDNNRFVDVKHYLIKETDKLQSKMGIDGNLRQ